MARVSHASRKKRGAPAVPKTLWVLVAAMVVLFITLLLWLGSREPQPEGVPSSTSATSVGQSPAARQDTRAVAQPPAREPVPPPRYEFYNILPSQTVEVPPAPPPAPPPPAQSAAEQPQGQSRPTSDSGGSRYELQVGSFRRYEEADRRKAELALLGFSSTIRKASVNGENWHRVMLGPMSEAEARKLRDRLRAVGMDPLLVKLGG